MLIDASFLFVSSKLVSKPRSETASRSDFKFLLSILLQKILFLSDYLSMLFYIYVQDRNCSLSILVEILSPIISSWSRWICCLIVPIPQAAVHSHMQVLVLPISMNAKCQAYIADHTYDIAG